ncbi:elongation factor G [Oscillatoria sp. FACHB-1406]|uniref:elongation factor G n=1 Tax=Oscillatoria sp. FACHB-1406 TaxID=2692846 RepID=UPI0016822721|nr:elongation factor G [Oscillatoria sp. FACHB-1406]MBD2579159.1 elongation factor G [Oscillatoria sp. FACHB-1406]
MTAIPRERIRNIGISAHIDSGKTTLSERILFYTGKIHKIEEVRGGGDGATLDYMELEQQKGITITSAATTCAWNDYQINLIDTPGHVDFTIEVERSLRVLDGGIMVLCGVAGVQSQSFTVDRQMKRYGVPRIAFINKLDRAGADPFRVVQSLKDKLNLSPILLQLPIGLEDEFSGVIDLIEMRACTFEGENGENWTKQPIPDSLQAEAQAARDHLLDRISLYSDAIVANLLAEQEVPSELIWEALRQATLKLEIVPVLLGSAYKNKGVQNLLDAVTLYLPSPLDRKIVTATNVKTGEEVNLEANPDAPFVGLAFKLTDDEFGQLTYVRIYAGRIVKGTRVINSRTGSPVRVSRIVRLHADERQDIENAEAGDIVAFMGVDCASGDTLCAPERVLSLEAMFVPEPVITLAITPKSQEDSVRMAKALNRFVKEDPTLRASSDPEANEILISGMGELHLEIYLERMRREYNAEVYVGKPAVAYRETIARSASFDYTLKKQTGGSGQYARVVGSIEPCEEGFSFENRVVGGAIPKQFIPGCEKGFRDAIATGRLRGYPVVNVKVILSGGDFHPIDSSENAFRFAAHQGFEQAFDRANPLMLEPIMLVEVETPSQFVGRIQGDLLSRRGTPIGSEVAADYTVLRVEVPLAEMFGYSTNLRSATQGMATFSMEFSGYRPMAEKVGAAVR